MRAGAFAVCAVLAVGDAASAGATSFDCKPYVRSRECPEIVICQTPGLSAKDDELAKTYTALRSSLADAAELRRLKQQQLDWLGHRNACRCNAECISDEYDVRSIELFRIMNPGQ
jgi:uncharacterized protein